MKLMSTGKGPSDLDIATKERKKQELEAEGLAQIITNREALKMQLDAEENPEHFVPGRKASHRPAKNSQKGVEGVFLEEKGKGKGKSVRSKLPNVRELAQRILQAESVMKQSQSENEAAPDVDAPTPPPKPVNTRARETFRKQQQTVVQQQSPQGYTPRRSTRQNNPPFVTLFNERAKYKCLGCNGWIWKKNFPHPRDLLFTLKAIRPFINPRTQEFVHPERNGFFHLDIKCLKLHDNTIEMRQATVSDEVFMRLSQQQLEYLNSIGILRHITANKAKTL